MRTYNGRTIAKKQIQNILRTENRTEIFRLFHQIYGGKVERKALYLFIQEFAPTLRVREAAYRLAYEKNVLVLPNESANYLSWRRANIRHIAMSAFRDEVKRGTDRYTKRPMIWHTHLYFCSPIYGHRDYNRWQVMLTKGNERFCELLCQLADKYLPTNQNKEED